MRYFAAFLTTPIGIFSLLWLIGFASKKLILDEFFSNSFLTEFINESMLNNAIFDNTLYAVFGFMIILMLMVIIFIVCNSVIIFNTNLRRF